MNIRLYNAKILSMNADEDIFDGEIWIKDDKIAYVGNVNTNFPDVVNDNEIPLKQWDREIDCKNNLLMPGFKDAHTHSPMTFLRSYADDLPLDKWLNEKVFPNEEKLDADSIRAFAKVAVLEYLHSGITGIFDMYLQPDVVGEVCEEMGMRCVLVSGLNDFTSSVEQTQKEYLKWNQPDSLISYKLGFHAEYTCQRDLLIRL
ncbi:MAG: amidohydrolase family protein [Lachnospiraceae bacterium]|nr:amidohydrolase family protein [Lachnospiraceae bacterium]